MYHIVGLYDQRVRTWTHMHARGISITITGVGVCEKDTHPECAHIVYGSATLTNRFSMSTDNTRALMSRAGRA